MSASGRFTIFPPSVIYTGPTTLSLTYHHRVVLQPQQKVNRVDVSGAIDAGANLLAMAEPISLIGTRSLSALLAVVDPTKGLKLTGGGVLRFQQADDDNGVFMTSTNHVTETFGLGYLQVESITAAQESETGAEAALRVHILSSDGLTDPITSAVNADFTSAPAPAFGTEYYLGPTYYNSQPIPGILSSTVEFGVTISPFFSSGAVFPTSVRIAKRRPVLKVKCAKVSADAAASCFLRTLAGPFVTYFQKAVDAGTRVAAGSSAHVKFSAAAGAWFREEQGGQGLDDASVTYCCYPTTNITYSAASTIP